MNEKDPRDIVRHLSPNDAWGVLQQLAAEDESLAQRIADVATVRLSQVDPEEVGLELYDELCRLEIEDAWDRAGRTRYGYVEPHEVAYEMINTVVEPFLEELKKYQALGMHTEANRFCMGLLLGLYKFEHECRTQFRDWMPDAGISCAKSVVDAWKGGTGSREDFIPVRVFIEEELWRWENLLK
jgi:hypothetical protein